MGSQARLAKFYFERDTVFRVAAFTADSQYIEEDEFCGLPIVPIESVSSKFPQMISRLLWPLDIIDELGKSRIM